MRTKALAALVGALLVAMLPQHASANYLDDNAVFAKAISALRAALGEHPRVLQIEVDARGVEIEAQDPQNRSHIDRWRYGTVTYLHLFSTSELTGPEAVEPQRVNPNLEENLFDFDAVDFSAAAKLASAAIARAGLQDPGAVTHMEIQRRVFILPKPSSGDVRWTLTVSSGREHAEIFASAQGAIVGADVSQTERARNLDLLRETNLVPNAAEEFRDLVGAGSVLTEVSIRPKDVGFATNIRDRATALLGSDLPSVEIFTWDLNGLQQQLGRIDVNVQMGTPGPAPFSVGEVDWTILAKLEKDALAKDAIPQASVTRLEVAKSSERPGGPVLVWTVEITEPSGEVTKVVADAHGSIQHVVLPPSRRPAVNWLDAATIASAIAHVATTFGTDTRIASIVFEDRGGRITIQDPAKNGEAQTFDFADDGATRAGYTFQLDARGARFSVSDVAVLDEAMIAKLEAEALKRLGGSSTIYLESVSIGAHPFEPQAGAHAIEIRVRDVAQDSARANYAWIVFDFTGRVIDLVTF